MKIKTIGLVAPSGNIDKIENLEEKILLLEKNFKVKKFYNEKKSFSYLADNDENRARYFEQAFLDEEVDLVISLRGGYGALRIVDKINYDLIKNSSKAYVGSSDATILLCAISKKTNISCYHGLMISNGFIDNLKRNVEIIENNIFDIKLEALLEKNVQGVLWGGNLSSLVSMFSYDSFIPNEDIILFLEDLNEPLYKIDKMIYEIYRFKKLKNKIKAIIFGDFYIEKEKINPLIENYSKMFDVPCFLTCDITHKTNNVTIPFLKKVDLKNLF